MRVDELGLTLADIDLGGIDAESDPGLEEYFVTTPYVLNAFSGRRTLFLGRKGSGKSALFTQLPRLAGISTFALLR
jgi:ABC-type multidrug transport system fused ATPase/permease subunit